MAHVGEERPRPLVANSGTSKATQPSRHGFEMELEWSGFVEPKALDSFPGASLGTPGDGRKWGKATKCAGTKSHTICIRTHTHMRVVSLVCTHSRGGESLWAKVIGSRLLCQGCCIHQVPCNYGGNFGQIKKENEQCNTTTSWLCTKMFSLRSSTVCSTWYHQPGVSQRDMLVLQSVTISCHSHNATKSGANALVLVFFCFFMKTTSHFSPPKARPTVPPNQPSLPPKADPIALQNRTSLPPKTRPYLPRIPDVTALLIKEKKNPK